MQHCLRHMEEPGTGECRHCHGTFCARCLVYSFGPKKPPYCVGCALVASGVRSGSRRVHQAADQDNTAAATGERSLFGVAPPMYADSSRRSRAGRSPVTASAPGSGDRSVRSSWSERRAERQATKAARRSAQDSAPVGTGPSGPIDGRELQPLLSPNDRKALGRLSASNF